MSIFSDGILKDTVSFWLFGEGLTNVEIVFVAILTCLIIGYLAMHGYFLFSRSDSYIIEGWNRIHLVDRAIVATEVGVFSFLVSSFTFTNVLLMLNLALWNKGHILKNAHVEFLIPLAAIFWAARIFVVIGMGDVMRATRSFFRIAIFSILLLLVVGGTLIAVHFVLQHPFYFLTSETRDPIFPMWIYHATVVLETAAIWLLIRHRQQLRKELEERFFRQES